MPAEPIKRNTPAIISASRLSDIPRFYAEWFANRRKQGHCISGNSFGGRYWVSLRNEDVLAYLFWTRDARPLLSEVKKILDEGIPTVFQFTVTAYGNDLERNRVPLPEQIESIKALADLVARSSAIQLRYDPIVVSGTYSEAWHEDALGNICCSLEGKTKVVNTSFCEPYLKVVSRIPIQAAYREADPDRHPTTIKKFPKLTSISEPIAFLRRLSKVSAEHKFELRVCANPELSGSEKLPASHCCGMDLFSEYSQEQRSRLLRLKPGPSRQGCNCIQTCDIGMTDTCPGGCLYCYVTGALNKSAGFYARHDPMAGSLRPW